MQYDAEVDVLLIELVDAEPDSSFDYEEGVIATVDATGRIIALEIIGVRDRMVNQDAENLRAALAND